jgi:hypothetical protein
MPQDNSTWKGVDGGEGKVDPTDTNNQILIMCCTWTTCGPNMFTVPLLLKNWEPNCRFGSTRFEFEPSSEPNLSTTSFKSFLVRFECTYVNSDLWTKPKTEK